VKLVHRVVVVFVAIDGNRPPPSAMSSDEVVLVRLRLGKGCAVVPGDVESA
jgi:hypothetical protein